MKSIKLPILVFFIAVPFLFSCTNQKKQESIDIKEWHILGPFKTVGQVDNLQYNNLAKWGFDEKTIDYSSFIGIAPDSGVTNSIYTLDSQIIDFSKHFSIKDFLGNAYAACSFSVSDTAGYYINFSCDDGGKVYLNNEEFIDLPKAGAMLNFEIYRPVKLKKGKNFLLIKVNNSLMDWQASIKIKKYSEEDMDEHRNVLAWLNNNTFFKYSIYDTTNTVILSKNLSGANLKFEIFSDKKSSVLEGMIQGNTNQHPNISGLPDGLYCAVLHVNGLDLTQDIYKGDLEKELARITTHLKDLKTGDLSLKGTIDANVIRFHHLMKPENRGSNFPDKQSRQRKLIYLYKTLVALEKNVSEGKTNQGLPGIVLHSFVSKIDDQNQFYLSHAPRDYDPKIKYPVAIYVPARVVTHRPYLESMRVADVAFQENLQYWSDKYQMIILEPFGRVVGRFNFNSIEETDLFELLSSAKTSYTMDTTRMFLIGSCLSADRALRLAVRYPHLFAGLGFVSPAFASNFSDQEWDIKNLPFDFLENIKKMPIFIIHSKNDKHTDISNSLFFEKLAKENHLERFTFIQTENDIEEFLWYKYAKNVFDFISKQEPNSALKLNSLKMNDFDYNTNQTVTILERDKRNVISRIALNIDKNDVGAETSNVSNFQIDLSKLQLNKDETVSIKENGTLIYSGAFPNNGIFTKKQDAKQKSKPLEGPFTKIFTDRFIIVIGSSGTPKATDKNKKTAEFFNKVWNDKYFNDCIVRYDYQITDSDIKNANLFLIGDFTSNKILKNMEGRIPIRIENNKITIADHPVNGSDLNVYMAYPNPENSGKFIGIFSGSIEQNIFNLMDISKSEFIRLLSLYGDEAAYFDISCFGWYDYRVWDNSGTNLYSGYFNDDHSK